MQFKLTRETKHNVRIGDKLSFGYGSPYIVTNVIVGNRGCVNYTLQDIATKQTLYAERSSNCYGAMVTRD